MDHLRSLLCLTIIAGTVSANPNLGEIFNKALKNIRYFDNPLMVNQFAQACRAPLTDFAKCMAGSDPSLPRDPTGQTFVQKSEDTINEIMNHEDALELQEINEEVEACFSDNNCVIKPAAAIECFLEHILNGKPFTDVTTCVNKGLNTDLDLSIPDLGNLEKLKGRLEFFVSVGLYKKYVNDPSSGKTTFWAKFESQLASVCLPNRISDVKQCVADVIDNKRAMELDLKKLAGDTVTYLDNIPVEGVFLSRAEQQALTAFGSPDDLRLLTKIITQSIIGCGMDFMTFYPLNSDGTRRKNKKNEDLKVCFNPLNMQKQHGCAHLFYIPRCFHYALTLVKGVCECRTKMVSKKIDPFQNPVGFLRQGQADFISAVAGGDFEDGCELGSDECEDCADFGDHMEREDVDLTNGFHEEIELVTGLIKKVCDFTHGLRPFKKKCNEKKLSRVEAKKYKSGGCKDNDNCTPGVNLVKQYLFKRGRLPKCKKNGKKKRADLRNLVNRGRPHGRRG